MTIAKSQAYQDAADAPSILRAYASDVKNSEAWCERNDLTAFPASAEVVGAYLAAACEGYAMQTLRRRVAAIARASGVAGHPRDTKHPAIREILRGICDESLTGDRDRALLRVCFAGALRRSELVSRDAEKLIWFEDGLKLLLEKSKTDKEGKGAEVTIVRGRHEATCPVGALRQWLDKAQIKSGPLFPKG